MKLQCKVSSLTLQVLSRFFVFFCVFGCNPNPANLKLNPPLPVTDRGGFQLKICWAGSTLPCLSRGCRAFFKYKHKSVQHPLLTRLCLTTLSSHNEHTDRNSLQQVCGGGVKCGIKNAGSHFCNAVSPSSVEAFVPLPCHLTMNTQTEIAYSRFV